MACLSSASNLYKIIHIPYIPNGSSLTGSTRLNPNKTSLRDRGVGQRALTWLAAEREFGMRSLKRISLLPLAEPKSESPG